MEMGTPCQFIPVEAASRHVHYSNKDSSIASRVAGNRYQSL